MNRDEIVKRLLVEYVDLLAERHNYGPGDGFEYQLWDDLHRPTPTLVSESEKDELVGLIIAGDVWVTCNLEVNQLQAIDLAAWLIMLEHREHS